MNRDCCCRCELGPKKPFRRLIGCRRTTTTTTSGGSATTTPVGSLSLATKTTTARPDATAPGSTENLFRCGSELVEGNEANELAGSQALNVGEPAHSKSYFALDDSHPGGSHASTTTAHTSRSGKTASALSAATTTTTATGERGRSGSQTSQRHETGPIFTGRKLDERSRSAVRRRSRLLLLLLLLLSGKRTKLGCRR